MNVPLLDLGAQYRSIKAEIDAAIAEVMDSQHFILGPAVERCEEGIATYCGTSHAVGVSSGSDALLACLMAEGIGPGDEVITSPYTFFATAGAIARVGATPVFADIDPATYNLDPSGLEAHITANTRAIIPVHLFGQMADMETIMPLAAARGLCVIEDAAQAIGAEHNGRRAGAIGHYGCLSFFPSKNLGAAGDGGMVLTNDAARAAQLRRVRAHGAQPKYHHAVIGGNFRLDALQAAIVSVKLRYLDQWTQARQANAARYNTLLRRFGASLDDDDAGPRATRPGADRLANISLPPVVTDRHIFNQYVIRVLHRDRLKAILHERGIATEIYYPVPMHLQPCFTYLGFRPGAFPVSEAAARETLALPIYPELTEAQAQYVADCINDFLDTDVVPRGGWACFSHSKS